MLFEVGELQHIPIEFCSLQRVYQVVTVYTQYSFFNAKKSYISQYMGII